MTERMHAANVGYALFDSQVVLYNDGETSTRSEHPPGPVWYYIAALSGGEQYNTKQALVDSALVDSNSRSKIHA